MGGFKRTCYISCMIYLKSSTTLTAIFLDKNCSRQCSFMTQERYWTPIDPLATLKGVSRGPSKVNHAGDVTGPFLAIFSHFNGIPDKHFQSCTKLIAPKMWEKKETALRHMPRCQLWQWEFLMSRIHWHGVWRESTNIYQCTAMSSSAACEG